MSSQRPSWGWLDWLILAFLGLAWAAFILLTIAVWGARAGANPIFPMDDGGTYACAPGLMWVPGERQVPPFPDSPNLQKLPVLYAPAGPFVPLPLPKPPETKSAVHDDRGVFLFWCEDFPRSGAGGTDKKQATLRLRWWLGQRLPQLALVVGRRDTVAAASEDGAQACTRRKKQ